MRILVTGGLGFIGSHLVRRLLNEPDIQVDNLDALTYAGNLANLADLADHPRYTWHRASITDAAAVEAIFAKAKPDAVMHLAAESHVDRSIENGMPFVETNVVGTEVLLEAARRHQVRRFLHVSTDEVYGSLGPDGYFREDTPLQPRSPYSASKAASDMLALAQYHTYGQDVVVTRCSNNYGPYQFPEKLIPLWITNGLEGKPWPIYGDGLNVRDWIYVEDHVEGLWLALTRGKAGQVYNLGTRNEQSNREVAQALLALMGLPPETVVPVKDRLGHDRRYAIDPGYAEKELGFTPRVSWEEGLRRTVDWYRTHTEWWQAVKSGDYLTYYRRHYAQLESGEHES
ncbi:dTDP-glucose 4,6-dehydratase [Sulfobacillus harzensis]|uniref:dTDP-glucose 4,6-dehydratase n=1 Tax=Sulfobacillus harzensis TaxID=2729629 RepID=A0A7Y0Q1W1_9FIRM|nr:dTDP-glucose 4,6-dehydratase [Sulfobacillus harzensis]